jgi:hypothetical protein
MFIVSESVGGCGVLLCFALDLFLEVWSLSENGLTKYFLCAITDTDEGYDTICVLILSLLSDTSMSETKVWV